MITKTLRGDLGLGLPEKNQRKKKKKVVMKEPKTGHPAVNSNGCCTEVCPPGAMLPTESVTWQQGSKTPLAKKKKKKMKGRDALCEGHLEPETMSQARCTEKSPSPRTQAPVSSEFLSGDKKKKRKSLWPLSPDLSMGPSLDPRQGKEVTGVGKELKIHKKKKAQEATAFSARHIRLVEAGNPLSACSVERDGQEQAALGQKRKHGSPREHSMKKKKKEKKKKTYQEGEIHLGHPGHPEPSRSRESSPRKGSKKKPVEVEASEYIPAGDGLKSPVKKKVKSNKKAEQPSIEEPALKRKKTRKRKEDKAAEDTREEEPDTDLEVVLVKKGNMDEAHIDQVRRKALQEEIDRESGKTETSETQTWTGTQFGQWDTAGFENEEQKLKFLKLMGGLKNPSPSFSHSPNRTGRPNMALGRTAAGALQRSLQQDYDRALSWKHRRGAGLGFSPTQNKVFYIDRNASRSVKFED